MAQGGQLAHAEYLPRGFADRRYLRELTKVEKTAKRLVDVTGAACAIVVLAPFMLLIAFLVKIEDGGSIFFRQQRTGQYGRIFQIVKFRTMRLGTEMLFDQTRCGDDHLTKCGSLLRRFSIDEWPQFFNVLLGDMSLVGPRPHAVSHEREFRNGIADYHLRFSMKPGISGLAQIHMLRGSVTEEGMRRRLEYDLRYVREWSLVLDM